jgi:glutathione synthase/RimK-type ligase-like ATP-grasp enzyme
VIVRTTHELDENYHLLKAGDIVAGQMMSAHLKAAQLVDLLQRGVVVVPSSLAQLLSRSKVAQAELLNPLMHPLTRAIRRRKDLLEAVHLYGGENIGAVISKQDHLHCGHGVRRWDHIETLYSFCGLDRNAYPFVLQPFVEKFEDVRVIMVGEYEEAYIRRNQYGFRSNLSMGGTHHPYSLSPAQRSFCRHVMERTLFPYAHLDLQIMIGDDTCCYLFEITLNGGIRGSRLQRSELDALKARRLDELVKEAGNV